MRVDELVDKYDVEKIRVVGEGYMVAAGTGYAGLRQTAGVPRRTSSHPDPHRVELEPLIAGVIGREKFFYALWGDMVNTASRMESHEIQITRATYELVRDDFECEYIGEISVKDKGRMEAWHLLAKKEERRWSHAGNPDRQEVEVEAQFESRSD